MREIYIEGYQPEKDSYLDPYPPGFMSDDDYIKVRRGLCEYFYCSDSNGKQYPGCEEKKNTRVCKAIFILEFLRDEGLKIMPIGSEK